MCGSDLGVCPVRTTAWPDHARAALQHTRRRRDDATLRVDIEAAHTGRAPSADAMTSTPDRRLSPIGLSFFRHPACGNTARVYRDCSDNFESRSIPGNHRYLASCIYKIIRWQCRHASCRLRASVQTVRAWRMPAIHGAPHPQSRKGGSQLPVPFKPCVVLSILEIDPCQRIPVEKPAD
jgi:hypothetical protein